MRAIFLIAVVLVGCTVRPGGPPAEPLTDAEMTALLSELTVFAANEMRYLPLDPPRVTITPSLRDEYKRLHDRDIAQLDYWLAAYDPTADMVFIHNWVDLRSVEGRATLAHEVTHYLQHHKGVPFCRYTAESDAYRVQFAYLNANGRKITLNPTVAAARASGIGCD